MTNIDTVRSKQEAAARIAAKLEDDNDYQLTEDEEEQLREMSEMDKAEFRARLRAQIFLERRAKESLKKEGARNRARLLFCILVYVCKIEPGLATFFCSLIDDHQPDGGGGGGSCPPVI